MTGWSVTVSELGKRRTTSWPTREEAFEALAAEVLGRGEQRRAPQAAFAREIAPGDQVVVRAELRGRGGSGGIDLRGDGSAQAFTGRWIRKPVAPQGRETAVQALRRVLQV